MRPAGRIRVIAAESALLALGMAGLLWGCGYSALDAARALLHGAFGSWAGLEATARRACPLLFAGLGVAVAFRTGLWNIGAEGQLLVGAVAACWTALRGGEALRSLGPAVPLLMSSLAGAAWASVAGVLRNARGVPEVITTIVLNFIALELLSYAVQGPLHETAGAYPQTDLVPEATRLAVLVAGTQLHTGLILGLICALGLHGLLHHTALGLELRALGAAPGVAAHVGIPAGRRVLQAMALSGAMAGLAGGTELLGVTQRLFERFSPGYGFTAIAVALLGGLRPLGVVPAALFFGALEAGAGELQRSAGVPSVLVSVLQGAVLIGGLLWAGRRG
jgi:general nucleoside transport system permease protein